MKPAWIIEGEKHLGQKEYPGAANNPWIVSLWKLIKRGGIKADAVPWCAAYVGGCLEAVGIKSTRFESAKSYLTWGVKLTRPVYGCIAVFSRAGGGHVGFVVGSDGKGRLLILGGNQGDAVSIAPIEGKRAVGYRWPAGIPVTDHPLPIFVSDLKSSTNEA